MGNLPSRAADNLFWLGRYLERAEATLRLIRCLVRPFDRDRFHLAWNAPDRRAAAAAVDRLGGGAQAREGGSPDPRRLRRPPQRRGLRFGRLAVARGAAHRLRHQGAPVAGRLAAGRHARSASRYRGGAAAAGDRGLRARRPGLADDRGALRPDAGEHEPRRRLAFPRYGAAHRARHQYLPLSRAFSRAPTRRPTISTWCST